MPRRSEFKHSKLILGEGIEDASFARAFIAARGLREAEVDSVQDLGGVGGNSAFEKTIAACEPIPGFNNVLDVVILADNDANPAESFENVRRQIENARNGDSMSRRWGDATAVAVKAAGDPSASIWMWPAPGEMGCLETLIWPIIEDTHPRESACVDAAFACATSDGWPHSKLHKAKVRCFISLIWRRNPALTLNLLWRDAPDLIPLNHSSLDDFERFLNAV